MSSHVTALVRTVVDAVGSEGTEQAGVGFGTSFGAVDATHAFLKRLFDKGPALVNPLEFPNLVHNAPAGYASINTGAAGPNLATCQEEVAGDEAVRVMAERVASSELERAVACGADLDSPLVQAGYDRVDRLFGTKSQHAGVLGAVHLEALTERSRGRAWARLLASRAAGRPEGVRKAVESALAAAGLESPHAIDIWCQGGTERLTRAEEASAAVLQPLANSERIDVRARLGDAGGAGAACVAVAAALIAQGRARHVLVTSVTRGGLAYATLLGAIA